MANVKITELTAATALAGTDVLPIVDVGADATKKVSVSDLLRNLPDGTASAPALAFADDQNTGVLSPGDNSLAFATNATQRLVIDSAGKFGFGTSTVSTAKFTFNSAGTNEVARFESTDAGAYLSLKDSTSSSINFIEGGADQFSFGTNSTERLRIDSNGRVGIGTTSPENNLHIADTSGPIIRLTNSTGTDGTYTGRISTGDAAGTFFAGINFFKHDTNDGEIRFRTKVDGTNQDTVTIVDGRVGVGTSSADRLLHLSGADTAIIRLENTDTSLTADQIIGGLEFEKQDGSGAGAGVVGGLRMYSEGSIGESAYLTLSTASSSTNDAEAVRIDSSGQVGIGTTSPQGIFQVGTDFGGKRGGSSTDIVIADTTSGVTRFLEFQSASNATRNILFSDATTGNYGSIGYSHADDALTFQTAANERARIDTSGNVGIGESSPDLRLHVKETINVAYSADNATSDANNLFKLENPSTTANAFAGMAFRTGNGADLYFGSIQQSANAGDFYFANQNSTNKELMRIKSTGNVGIGTASPVANTPLTLQGPSGYTDTLWLKSIGTNIDSRINFGPTGTGDAQINNATGTDIAFQVSGSEKLRIDSSGNVGIGTSSPAKNLEISKSSPSLRFTDTSNNSYSQIDVFSSDLYIAADLNATDNGQLIFRTNGENERMRIDSSGNVGIATSSADFKLDVNGSIGVTEGQVVAWHDGSGNLAARIYGSSTDELRFEVGSGASRAMTIDSSGRLLVGETHAIADFSNNLLNISHASGAGIQIGRKDTSVAADNLIGSIQFRTDTGSGADYQASASIEVYAEDTHAAGDSPGRLTFSTSADGSSSPTEHFRIASNGDLTATDTTIGSNSDSRLKTNVANFTYNLDDFKQYQPKTFDWKNPELHGNKTGQRGFIAQDVEAIDAYWVDQQVIGEDSADAEHLDEDRLAKTLKLGKKDAMYVSVIQQLLTKIETLETKVAALEAQ